MDRCPVEVAKHHECHSLKKVVAEKRPVLNRAGRSPAVPESLAQIAEAKRFVVGYHREQMKLRPENGNGGALCRIAGHTHANLHRRLEKFLLIHPPTLLR